MSNATTHFLERRMENRALGVTSDQTIEFTGVTTSIRFSIAIRRIAYQDPGTSKHYVFLASNFLQSVSTIVATQ